MGKEISDFSIFGEYKQPENRVTAALLQICKIGGESLIREIFTKADVQLPDSEVAIITQPSNHNGKSVPDGLLKSSFSFNLYLESKISQNSIDESQLTEHEKLISKKTDFLIYITPDEAKPNILMKKKIGWLEWRSVRETLNLFTNDTSINNYELLSYLINEFNKLLDNMRLTNFVWSLENDQVLIVAGAWAEGIAIKHGYYICQNRRSFKPSRYLAFYKDSKINHLFEITESPSDDVVLSDIEELSIYLNEDEMDYSGTLSKIFKLRKLQNLNISNDKKDKNGASCPYTYGQPRYTSLKKIQVANKTSDL